MNVPIMNPPKLIIPQVSCYRRHLQELNCRAFKSSDSEKYSKYREVCPFPFFPNELFFASSVDPYSISPSLSLIC